MARINVEDSIFKDFRFMNLIMKTGSVDHALGCLVRSWILAQEWFLNEETGGMIPVEQWEKQGINNLLLEVGLAEKGSEKLIRVAGSDEQFSWLISKSENGKKGGRPKKADKSDENLQLSPAFPEKASESYENPLTLSHSLSPTLPQSLNHNTPLTPQGDDSIDRDSLRSAQEKTADELYRVGKKAKVKLDAVMELYNSVLAGVGKLRHCRDLGDKSRKEFINSLEAFPTIDHWKVVFEIVRKSKKLTGQVENPWLATLPWLVVKENALKVEAGTYDDDFESSKKKLIEKNLQDLRLD